jgi:hypothetical protein
MQGLGAEDSCKKSNLLCSSRCSIYRAYCGLIKYRMPCHEMRFYIALQEIDRSRYWIVCYASRSGSAEKP